MNNTIIEFKDFGFQYHAQSEPTLFDINLTVKKGEKLLIAGPSGCGKSTLAHCINGLIPFFYKGNQTGTLLVNGRETRKLDIFENSKTVGTVLQDLDGQFIGLTVAEDIAFALENDCVQKQEMIERVKKAARRVDVADHLEHAPNELSGGQKQRVSMAGIMVDEVEVFLFDEPLANLDPATGKQAIEIIDQIQKETKAAVIIIEHRLEDVLWREVDRIVLMNNGRIIADTTPDRLLSSTLLKDNGIREPLYLTAMKYAGITVIENSKPHSINSVILTQDDKQRLQNWYREEMPVKAQGAAVPLLEAKGINFTYENGFNALKDISLTVNKGELMAIVGTNGAGKSTFSKVICGFEKQQTGSLFFDGCDMSGLSIKERADRIGYVMQNPNQMISKSFIYDEVALGLRMRGLPENEIADKVEETLKICGLLPFRKWPISAISYGQKKRVTIASILALSPQMLILDEPTAGQDFKHYTEIMEFLRELNKRGITVMMITHDMHLMLEYADRAVAFSQGRVIADDTSANILTNPDIIGKASLKETSLYNLAISCEIDRPNAFVQHFIDYDREVRQR